MNCCDTTEDAVRHGHMQCMKSMIEDRSMEWDDDTTLSAVIYTEMEMLEYAIESECPWHVDAAREALKKLAPDFALYSLENGAKWKLCEIRSMESKWKLIIPIDDLIGAYEDDGIDSATLKAISIDREDTDGLEYVCNQVKDSNFLCQQDIEDSLRKSNSKDMILCMIDHGRSWDDVTSAILSLANIRHVNPEHVMLLAEHHPKSLVRLCRSEMFTWDEIGDAYFALPESVRLAFAMYRSWD